MKTIFRTLLVAGAVVMTAACGNNASKQTEQAAAEVVAVDPTVSAVALRQRPGGDCKG